MTDIEVKVGDWVVSDCRSYDWSAHRYLVREVIQVTKRQAFVWQFPGVDQAETLRLRLTDVLFVGSEDACRRLTERLRGSCGLMIDERRRAESRHQERVDKMIAEARAQ